MVTLGYSGGDVIGGDSGRLAVIHVLIWVLVMQISFGEDSLGYTLIF